MRTAILAVGTIVALSQSDRLMQPTASKDSASGRVSVSEKRVEEIKTTLEAAFDGVKKSQIQIAGAVKGSTAVGAIVSETKSDLAIVKNPCNAESAKRPIVFETPYEKKKVGEFVCANNKKFDKVEVEQR